MSKNQSPWIHQLDKDRPATPLTSDVETDVVVVGGGIAGVSTAFFLLKDTDKRVVLVEGGRLGHGATGHNAGQVTSYFARPLHDLVKDFGVEKVIAAQKNIEEDAWTLLNAMYTESGLDIPLARFTGFLGISNKEHLVSLLKDNKIRRDAGMNIKDIRVIPDTGLVEELKPEFEGLFGEAEREKVMEVLETKSGEFVACLSEQKGVMNSALFTEEVSKYLLEAYKDRFSIYEHTHIGKIALHEKKAILDAGTCTLTCERVVLATNGFANISIFNESGLGIDTRFHHSINAVIGYMSGYLDKPLKAPIAISYFTDVSANIDAPYIYLTRRPYEYNENKHNLISIGGPEINLDDGKEYERDHEYPDWAREEIDEFVKNFYAKGRGEKVDYIFTWHGLMGYTNNKIRLIGEEPLNPVLLYNLGCNGVGILPSIYGGKRIADQLAGKKPPKSIFDPQSSA